MRFPPNVTGLTGPQFESLTVLSRRQAYGATAKAVATARGWYPEAASNQSQVLDRLVAMGFAVDFTDGPRDRRRWEITDAGLQILEF